MDDQKKNIVVLGQSGLVAPYVIDAFAREGHPVHIISRTEPHARSGITWSRTEDLISGNYSPPPGSYIIGVWHISHVCKVVDKLAGAGQLITLSSTSIHNRGRSKDPSERELAQTLTNSERTVHEKATALGIPYTVLRPTIIYDCKTDESLRQIASVSQRFGFFPIPGQARGLRQPIHASDVVEAIIKSIDNDKASNRMLDLPGSETLTYRTMVERTMQSMGRTPRIYSVPTFMLKSLVGAMRAARLTVHSPSMIDRMNEDLAYDGSETYQALDFTPRAFEPVFPK